MIMIGYWGLFGIVAFCLSLGACIGAVAMALCRISSECSREEEAVARNGGADRLEQGTNGGGMC